MRIPSVEKTEIAAAGKIAEAAPATPAAPVKKTAIVAVVFAAAFAGFMAGHFYHTPASAAVEPTILYSLDKRANDQAVIDVINAAQKYVYFAVYTFTKSNIADALVAAKRRGVDVRGITDAAEAATSYEQPVIRALAAAGIAVETQRHEGLMHIKAVVTDKAYAMGSYNWTESATVANDELLEVGTDEHLRAAYKAIIEKILAANEGSGAAAAQGTAAGGGYGASAADHGAPATNGKIYSYSDAAAHVGETATIRGAPVDIYAAASGIIFFDYCKDYKNCPFSAVIFATDAPKFKDVARYQGKTIDVAGAIKNYGGKVEMAISDPGQITVAAGG